MSNTQAIPLDGNITKTILRLSWPAILEQFLLCLTTLVDTAMVGSIGEQDDAKTESVIRPSIFCSLMLGGVFLGAGDIRFQLLVSRIGLDVFLRFILCLHHLRSGKWEFAWG